MAAATAIKNVSFTNTIDGNREAMQGLWQALDDMRRCVILLHLTLDTVTPNAALLLERAQGNFSTATDLADALVRHGGLSFRQAHHVVGGVVREALRRGMRADHIHPELIAEVAQAVVGRAVQLSAAVVRQALDAPQAVRGRTVTGGPAPAEVRRMVQAAREQLLSEEQEHATRQLKVQQAAERLHREVVAASVGAEEQG